MHQHIGSESPEVLSRASSTKLALKSTGFIFDRATQAWKNYDPQNAVGTKEMARTDLSYYLLLLAVLLMTPLESGPKSPLVSIPFA